MRVVSMWSLFTISTWFGPGTWLRRSLAGSSLAPVRLAASRTSPGVYQLVSRDRACQGTGNLVAERSLGWGIPLPYCGVDVGYGWGRQVWARKHPLQVGFSHVRPVRTCLGGVVLPWFRDHPKDHPAVNAAELARIGDTSHAGDYAMPGGKLSLT